MSPDGGPHAPSDGGAAALEQWARLSDALLGGLAHALNNRITALGAGAELTALGDREAFATGALAAEAARLQRIGALLALLPMRREGPDALELGPVLQDALELHAHLPRARGVTVHGAAASGTEPVRAPRWALLRALLVLTDAAATDAEARGARATTLVVQSDRASVRVRIVSRRGAGPYAAVAASLCGGELVQDDELLELVMPSLTTVRQRERAAPARR